MTSEMVERVARAIDPEAWEVQDGLKQNAPDLWESEIETLARESLLAVGRSAITAMREPTNAMGYAGLIATNGDSLEGWPDDDRRAAFKALGDIGYGDCIAGNPSRWKKPIWRAMIDAALGGPDGA